MFYTYLPVGFVKTFNKLYFGTVPVLFLESLLITLFNNLSFTLFKTISFTLFKTISFTLFNNLSFYPFFNKIRTCLGGWSETFGQRKHGREQHSQH